MRRISFHLLTLRRFQRGFPVGLRRYASDTLGEAVDSSNAAKNGPTDRVNVIGSLVPLQSNSGNLLNTQTLFNIDTWHWVDSLRKSDPNMTLAQCEALTNCIHRIATLRLNSWQQNLPTLTHLATDLHLLRTLGTELERAAQGMAEHSSSEARRSWERLSGEVAAVGDQLREWVMGSKTDMSLAVNEWRGEGREEAGKLEMEQHQVEGRLAGIMSKFRSDAENVKVRSIYTFARTTHLNVIFALIPTLSLVVIVAMLVMAVGERSANMRSKSSSSSKKPLSPQNEPEGNAPEANPL